MTLSAPHSTTSHTAALDDLLDKLAELLQSGDPAAIEEFLAAHPTEADELRQRLPAMNVLAGLNLLDAANSEQSHQSQDLGDFRLIREVGRGGMGVVYEAEQLSLRRRVALKVLPFAATMDPKHLQRFKNEALAAASLEHPNIVPVHGVGCERGVHFYAMKFIEGQTLAQLIQSLRDPAEQQQPTSDETAAYPAVNGSAPTAPIAGLSTKLSHRNKNHYRRIAELVAHAADALEHAHSMGIVHRDVKPGNLLLDSVGKVYVSDFGLARFGDDANMTMSGDLIGTLRYMSPEQALARHGLVDHRTDIYSLGATLYEMLTLKPAVSGEDKAEILKSIAWEEPIALRKIDKSIPAELETITLKCLSKNPGDRYASAAEMADDLRRWLGDQTIKARPPGFRQRVAKWGRRHQSLVRGAVTVIFLSAVGLAVGTWVIWREREFTRLAKVAAEAREAETKAVLDFVESKIFAAARPENQAGGLGHDVTLRRALEAALPFVEKSFTDQPLIEARLRLTLGKSFQYLGDARIAGQQYEAARHLYSQHCGPDHPEALRSMMGLANSYVRLGRYVDALNLHQKTLALRKAQLGPEHPDTLKSMSGVALTYYHMGRNVDSLKLHEETLALRKAKLGPDHPDTLESMGNLGMSYFALGRHADALNLAEKTYAVRKAKLGPEHPDTLLSLGNVASSTANLGRHADALELFRVLLPLLKAKFGRDHAATLNCMQNLATCFANVGRHADALKLHEETLELRKAKFGPDHPDTLGSMDKVARSLANLDRNAEALKLREETLALRKANLGVDHPETLESMSSVAESYDQLFRYADAVTQYEKLLALRRAKLGLDHPSTLESMHNLAKCYATIDKHMDAVKLYEETLALRKTKLGFEHPDTLESMYYLAISTAAIGRYSDALKLHEVTLALRKARLGLDHRDTLASMNDLALCFGYLGRHDNALKLHEETLALRKAKLGPDASDTLGSMNNLAVCFDNLGRHSEALKLYEEAMVLMKVRMPGHRFTLNCMSNLAKSYEHFGRYSEALMLYEQALSQRKSALGLDHPDTLVNISGVATSLSKVNRSEEALPLIDDWLRRVAGRLLHPKLFSDMVKLRLRHFEKAKDAAGCRATAAMWEDQNRTDATSLYDSACMRAVTANVFRIGGESETAAINAERAMTWLSQAVAAGYKDAARMKNDKDLDLLRDRDDFKKLVAEVEAKANE